MRRALHHITANSPPAQPPINDTCRVKATHLVGVPVSHHLDRSNLPELLEMVPERVLFCLPRQPADKDLGEIDAAPARHG